MGRLICTEMPEGALEQAKDFYSGVLGLDIGKILGSDASNPRDAAGMPEVARSNLLSINVGDIDEALGKIAGRGGEVLTEKADLAGMGQIAFVKDPHGNLLGLWQPNELSGETREDAREKADSAQEAREPGGKDGRQSENIADGNE